MDRPDFDRLERVCRRLGEAVVDPAVWPELMEEICRSVGVAGAILLQADVRTPDVPRTEAVAELLRAYFAGGWHTRDIRAQRSIPMLLNGKKAFIDEDILTLEELEAAPLLNEVFLPKGFKWAAGVRFSAGPAMWGLCMHRTTRQQPFDAIEASLLETLSDRLTDVATLSTAVGRIALTSATDALAAVRQPAIALDRLGFVLDVNAPAAALFDREIRVANRRLVFHDAQARCELEKLTDRLRMMPDTEPFPCAPIVVRRREAGPVVARLLPVHGAARTPFLGARALLTLTVVERRSRPKAELLSRAFGLTPAEARLAAIVATGVNLERAAEELGISRETARSQLKAVLAKTDTHRQSELVALLLRL